MSGPRVLLIGGDGIGPEVVEAARRVLEAAVRRFGRELTFVDGLMGGQAIDRGLGALPDSTLERALDSQAVLLGAVGGPRWDHLPGPERPEAGLLKLRRALGAFANLRPVRVFPGLEDAGPLRPELARGSDLVIVRELNSGLYYGARGRRQVDGDELAFDTLEYTRSQVVQVGRVAFELARSRRRRLCMVDKANILESSRLWRKTVQELAREYPDVECTFQYVDACAMRLVMSPRSFDVILTENMFGDILSDEAAVLAGSLGMLPSASIGGPVGLYEPVHGTAPDIAGQGVANPIGAILSGALLMRYSLGWEAEARAVEAAVESVLQAGYRTPDLAQGLPGGTGDRVVGTDRMTELIVGAMVG